MGLDGDLSAAAAAAAAAAKRQNEDSRLIPFSIDLNETPSPSSDTPSSSTTPTAAATPADAYALACRVHGNPFPAPGPAAEFPGEPGLGFPYACGLCGRAESRGGTVVCDGCERGFHLSCARLRVRQLCALGDWVCGDCARNGVGSKRWPLGAVYAGARRGGVRLLDINALPPSDGDGDLPLIEDFRSNDNGNRMQTSDGDYAGGFSGQLQHTNFVYMGNGVASGKDFGAVAKRLKRTTEGSPQQGLAIIRGLEDTALNSSHGGMPICDNATVSASARLQQDMFLQSLREFISERQGYLDEGWHVEFKQRPNRPDSCALYCAPDGSRFESMFDVACYLGLASHITSANKDEKNDSSLFQKSSSRRRRRKELARLSRTSSVDNQDAVRVISGGEVSDTEAVDYQSYNASSEARVAETITNEASVLLSPNLSIRLPVQFKDFYITCLGKIDSRPAYHNASQIWPVGYKTCWHDQITGSLFECEVLDGGTAGPVFRVRRCSCSVMSILLGETVLLPATPDKPDVTGKLESDAFFADTSYDEDEQIQVLLSDPCPSGLDLLSSFTNKLDEHTSCFSNRCSGIRDEIGEFYVEGRSSSVVWKMVSQTLINACQEVYKQSHIVQFCCRHGAKEMSTLHSDVLSAKPVDYLGPLVRFCYASGPLDITSAIHTESDLEAACTSVSKWLDQDRFGLDSDFVQEIIEQLPGADSCSKYEFLNTRRHYSTSHTVGTGLLLAKRRNVARGVEEFISCDSYKGCKSTQMLGQSADPLSGDQCPPNGRSLDSRLPAELLGDVLQIWELFWRFYDILGLKEPLSFEELEAELIDPWPYGLNVLEDTAKEVHGSRNLALQGMENARGLSVVESDQADCGENTFIQIETESTKDAAQAKVASRTYGRCSGVALTRAHISLLKVLVGELQCKVACFADPNFDAAESKPRRGRRKEVDYSTSVKKPKIDMLPVNELTWPELARRYVLAVSAMDCNPDSAEISSREGAKVFRCLQGDGGILCGSLAGVAGMEADALLLAEAGRQISASDTQEHEFFRLEEKDSLEKEVVSETEPAVRNKNILPEWAQLLEPVRKLPTNVGTRIRKCVYDSLEKDPPQWARKILEHSISKEVYKGNASGPTKKAVLSVLADVSGESSNHKPEKGKKRKRLDSLSNLIMKQCRIVLRRSAAADEAKVFCNLLATALLSLNDNDDEGILGSPAMVSRPLDFRTIDLRLAVGAYGGSHEAFLEDVREVWHNICTAYGDRPDLMELAETLSQNFESLYEQEVLNLVQNFSGKTCLESLTSDVQKKLDDLLCCSNEIPKAPWEEGVCKVCGIDKDDDSVLLCDSCDSEYHTYCLNPPLSKIPAGNWYCPSCVAGQSKPLDSSYRALVIKHARRRRMGEELRSFKESLNRLAASLEEREYWDLNTEERTFLLKFLCDEVLNSALIREHLDQCADSATDLQQKLRSLSIEWRNMKIKEEMLTMRVAKENTSKLNGISETVREEGVTHMFANHGRLTVLQQNVPDASNCCKVPSDADIGSGNELKNIHGENGISDVDKQLDQQILKSIPEKYFNGKSTQICDLYELSDSKGPRQEMQINSGCVLDNSPVHESPLSVVNLSRGDKSSKLSEHQSIPVPQGQNNNELSREVAHTTEGYVDKTSVGVKSVSDCSLNRNDIREDDAGLPSIKSLDGSYHLPDNGKTDLDKSASPIPTSTALITSMVELSPSNHNNSLLQQSCSTPTDVTDSGSCNVELDSVKKDVSHLQDSIASLELRLFMASLRRDYMGRDSSGRIFWAVSRPGRRPWLLVDGSVWIQKGENDHCDPPSSVGLYSQNSVLINCGLFPRVSSDACGGADSDLIVGSSTSSSWILYESDMDIQELVSWLRDTDPRERELRECILQWQRVMSYQVWNQLPDGYQTTSKSEICEKVVSPPCLLTKATALLEKMYGPCLELEVNDLPRKRGRKTKANNEVKMYRCECLEPLWPSRYHCLSCHQTFCSGIELESHNDGRCTPGTGSDETKENDLSVKGKGTKSEIAREKECSDEAGVLEVPKYGNLDINSRLVKVQKKACPYNIEEISSKFITKNSNKEVVQEIGLIGSNGVPSLIQTTSSNFFDPSLMLAHNQKDDVFPSAGCAAFEERLALSSEEIGLVSNNHLGDGVVHFNKPPQKCVNSGTNEELPRVNTRKLERPNDGKHVYIANSKSPDLDSDQRWTIPESSLRPLYGKVSQILKRLKINLLDMDAALPEEALRPLKASSTKRCAWHAFVKSAESIYEMVQATILLEGMVRTDYLKNEWWYWSSLTAAAKTPTISSLALRIYSLDASIIYSKASQPVADITDNTKMANKGGKKRKDVDGGS